LVFYNRPFKRGRDIFGALVPYGRVWRTGANEATWFETNLDVKFGALTLKAGRYSLWTIPGEKTWKVIFNSTIPPWGVDYNSEAARNPATDIIALDIPVSKSETVLEQFTIGINKIESGYQINLLWDTTIISIPFEISAP
jgi:hypothetical protein